MKTLVVLPSYNEAENIIKLIDELLSQGPQVYVCVVDDRSPDQSAERVKIKLANNESWARRVHLIVRERKLGRGSAVRAGWVWGYSNSENFDVYVEMDCDFSHDPNELSHGITLISEGKDVVIGSRYPDGKITNWPLSRRIFSLFSNCLLKTLISRSISDYTNGFRFYSRFAITHLLGQAQVNSGFIYLSESIVTLMRADLRVDSFPSVFKNRERGNSQLNAKEIFLSLKAILSLSWKYNRK